MPDTTKFQYLMEFQNMDAVLVCAMGGCDETSACIIDANRAALEMLGYSKEELTNKDFAEIAPGVAQESILIDEGQIRFETEYVNCDGMVIPVEVDIHGIFTCGSMVWLMVARDLTERKRLEEELLQARLDSADACAIKSRFLANMSHELRTPLNGIMGMTQILLGTELTDDQREYLGLSLDATRHLTRILNDLLELSNIEAGGLPLVRQEFSLRAVLESLIHPLTTQAGKKGLTLTCDIGDDVPGTLFGDSAKIRQILINLLFNAIKFTEKGGVTLLVRCGSACREKSVCDISFTVRDTGVGIPEEQLGTIFESFTLGESIMTKQYGGLGLGLSISRQLAQLMHGTVTAESTPGKGSTFTFTVPLSKRAERPKDADDAPEQLLHAKALRILLAEDEQVNSIMASRLLRKEGHEVAVVGNGQQAMNALSDGEYDLILMDVQMPVINGIQATRFIRTGAVENVSRDIPIIGLTAFAQPEERQQFLEAGMNRVVTKPYEPEDLMRAVATSTRKE